VHGKLPAGAESRGPAWAAVHSRLQRPALRMPPRDAELELERSRWQARSHLRLSPTSRWQMFHRAVSQPAVAPRMRGPPLERSRQFGRAGSPTNCPRADLRTAAARPVTAPQATQITMATASATARTTPHHRWCQWRRGHQNVQRRGAGEEWARARRDVCPAGRSRCQWPLPSQTWHVRAARHRRLTVPPCATVVVPLGAGRPRE
jgi:hypothetical protein